MSGNLLAELPEDRATGAVAVIYDEIRRFSGVAYVSSLQRYLATMPGVLEWAWAATRPAMVSGVVPETGDTDSQLAPDATAAVTFTAVPLVVAFTVCTAGAVPFC